MSESSIPPSIAERIFPPRSSPDPVAADFPEPGWIDPGPTEGRVVLGAPLPKDTPTGLDLLKLWVHQFEAGQRSLGLEVAADLAAVIGAWEAERAAHSEAEVRDGERLRELRERVTILEHRLSMRPAHSEVIREAERLVVLSSGSVEKIADAVAERMRDA